MKTHIIVEGELDKQLLQGLLSDLPSAPERSFVTAHGKDAARPIVRKYLLRVGDPTAFVFDTDTTDPAQVQSQLRALTHYFQWGAPAVPFEMFPLVPSLEVLFFERPTTLERRLRTRLDLALQRDGARAPKQALESLLPALGMASMSDFFRSLTPAELDDLRQQATILQLHRFVERYLRAA